MSGTNPNIKAMAANTSKEKDGRTAGGFKTVYVRKDQRPVSITEVAPLTVPGWKRGSTFDHFTAVMNNLSETHDTVKIMTTVANKVPISTETAAAEAEKVAARVRKEIFCVGNLFGTKFMLGDGRKVATLKNADLDTIPRTLPTLGSSAC